MGSVEATELYYKPLQCPDRRDAQRRLPWFSGHTGPPVATLRSVDHQSGNLATAAAELSWSSQHNRSSAVEPDGQVYLRPHTFAKPTEQSSGRRQSGGADLDSPERKLYQCSHRP